MAILKRANGTVIAEDEGKTLREHCGSFGVNADRRLFTQFLAHLCRIEVDDIYAGWKWMRN